MSSFAYLHLYSGYSFLKSGLTLPKAVKSVLSKGLSHIALTDFCSCSGYPELTKAAKDNNLTPIYGLDVAVDGDLFTLLVASEEGYRNAIQILYLASKDALTIPELTSRTNGLVVILDGFYSRLASFYGSDLESAAPWLYEIARKIPSFFLGIPYLPNKSDYVSRLRDFADNHGYGTVAFPFVRYEKEEDAIVLSIVEAISNDGRLSEKKVLGNECFLPEEALFSYFNEKEIKATLDIASSLSFTFEKKRGGLLVYPNEEGIDSPTYLKKKAYEGLKEKGKDQDPKYIERLEYELGVIVRMGYADYFLIVADYVRFAKTHGIAVGPGRGSSAGSLVSYCLGIVATDPLKYDLLFERFLNPERQSMPDIDVDFSDVRREEVVAYLQRKYGHDRVSHIITMQTLGARASIRDIGRVYGYEDRQVNLLAKSIDPFLTLRQNYKQNRRFRELVDSDPYYLEIVSLAAKIEGLPRQAGLHAAGIVLNDAPLVEAIPVKESPEVGLVVDFEMTHLEEQGFLKMDLLGLRNLSIIDDCVAYIEKEHGIKLDPASIPYEDEKGIELIAKRKTMGLFQLESPGMNRAIAEVKPTCFEDIVAIIALYRPGPMENIPTFARRKAGKEKITYLDPRIEPILSGTYGVIVYQEQIMQIVRALAGFSYGQADVFRRAISKKDAAKLASLKSSYISGCLSNGVSPSVAEQSYDLIYKFADYGFNKSHALVYAVIACQMAYLKARYPLEFYAAILNGMSQSDPKMNPIVSEIKSSGYSFALPDVNEAELRFLPKKDKLMFPLTAIKGIQGALCAAIVEERQLNGPYEDLFDFALRNKRNGLTQSSFIKLIDSGCFDSIDPHRGKMRLGSSSALDYAEMLAGSSGNELLLSLNLPKPSLVQVSEDPMLDLLLEKENIGFMVSGSPLFSKKETIESRGLLKLSALDGVKGYAKVAAIVGGVKTIVTKKGAKMAFVSLYDEERNVEMTMFSSAYDESYPALKEGNLVQVNCHRDTYRGGGFLADRIEVLP